MSDPERSRRKREHIEAVSVLTDAAQAGFEDILLLPASASEIDVSDVSMRTTLFGRALASPVVINAMTGGTPEALAINARLAQMARRHGMAMAVGSETAALRNPDAASSFRVVRDLYPDGCLIANVGMRATPEEAQQAIDLIGADALQVHWNTAQELFMPEGDRSFRGLLDQLTETCARATVPVVAKEVGQGMLADAARRFLRCGVRGIDVGGRGGTNFIQVEALRAHQAIDPEWERWGVSTACSLAEVLSVASPEVAIVASGGIRTGHDVAKCLAMGATAVGVAGPLLRLAVLPDAEERLDVWATALHATLRTLMVLVGASDLQSLRQRPLLVVGQVREWLELRGLGRCTTQMARRDGSSGRPSFSG